MRLTTFSDYALRLLILCAGSGDKLVTIAGAAGTYGISRSHLMKIANELVRAGFLHSVRGRNGGLRLARSESDISIGAVIRHMEQQPAVVECLAPASNTCVIAPACSVKFLFAEATEDFFRRLDSATLADVTRKPAQMRALLGLDARKRGG